MIERLYCDLKKRGLIDAAIRPFIGVDPASGLEDLYQIAFLGVKEGVKKYKRHAGSMKLSTLIFWYIQKKCRAHICNGAPVEVSYRDGNGKMMSAREFQRNRKELEREGCTWKRLRAIPLEEVENGKRKK